MKIFTKIILAISGTLLCIGVVCFVIATSMGLTWNQFHQMIKDGKFSFDLNDVLVLHLDFDFDDDSYSDLNTVEITETCSNLDIEFGAGSLEIKYADVEHILIEQENVIHFDVDVDDETLQIEGGLDIGIHDTSDATLTITIPQDMVFDSIDMEIGASVAVITDLNTDILSIEVGAGSATINGLHADTLSIAVGAGKADVNNLNVKKLDAEVGVGELNATLLGSENDYNYKLECGIGSVQIGKNSYDGLGASQNVNHPDANRRIDIECGIGKVDIDFTE